MRYFLIAGEASGDLHASALMHELKKVDVNAEFCFLGGDLMQKEGGEMIKHYKEMAFMGFVNVIKNLNSLLITFSDCKNAIKYFNPDAVILIDYPGFNLRIAKYVKHQLQTPVYYYIPPKIWAWKEYRIKSLKKFTDRIFTIFPFETAFYRKHNYDVTYVGNPTAEKINQYKAENKKLSESENKPYIVLLPGSRKQEISSCLPKMIEAASDFPEYDIIVTGAPGIEQTFYKRFIQDKSIPVVFEQTYSLLNNAKLAVVNSGTATLETAIIGTPQIVVYHVNFGKLASLAKKIFLKVKYISLVNLIANSQVVKELVAEQFTTDNLSKEIERILTNKSYREKMIKNYSAINQKLGEGRASKNIAAHIYSEIVN